MAKGNAERRAIYLPSKTVKIVDIDTRKSTSARIVSIIHAYYELVKENLNEQLTEGNYRDLVASYKNESTADFETSALFNGMTRSQILATEEVITALSEHENISNELIASTLENIKKTQHIKESSNKKVENIDGNK